MKIGEFAKKHEVTIDTVRYYIEEGLLTPFKENTQYCFTEIDDDVMDSIMALKNMNFKIDEMKAYLLFQTLFTNSTFNYLGGFRQRFLDKLEENKQEIKRLQKINKIIESRVGTGEREEENLSVSRGISLKFIGSLVCPDCNESLELCDPILEHNEVVEGRLLCPDCGKEYYIRYGILSDDPITDIEIRTDGLSDAFDKYIKINDKDYIANVRTFFQMVAAITREHSSFSKTVLIDGSSAEFLNSALIRSVPKEATLIIHCKDNVSTKFMLQNILPENTIFYIGDMEKFPMNIDIDYFFWQDYDITSLNGSDIQAYRGISNKTKMDCFKTLFYDNTSPFLNEDTFLQDMRKRGWVYESDYKTGRLLIKKSSSDWNIVDRQKDDEIEYCVYTFKSDHED